MAWIELHEEMRDHPKLGRLSRELGVSRAEARGIVIGMWLWAATYAPDGDLSTFDASDIADGCDYTGDKNLLEALVKAKWLDDETLKIHDWDKHGLKMLKSSQERQKKFRERVDRARQDEQSAGGNEVAETAQIQESVTSTSPSRDSNVAVASYLTIPNHTKPTATSTAQTAAVAAVDNSKPKAEEPAEERPAAVPAAPGQDLEQVIYDRIGWTKRLSRFDLDKLLALKRAHGELFFKAADKLHGGVTNVPAFMEKVVLALAKEKAEPAGGKKCKKCGSAWDPWKTGKSLCPVCYPEDGRPAAQITQLVSGLAAQMGRTA